jgi:hypothetical protein
MIRKAFEKLSTEKMTKEEEFRAELDSCCMGDEEEDNTYKAWTPTQVANWLTSINTSFKECGPLILKLGVDGAFLKDLVNDDRMLAEIEITAEQYHHQIREAFEKLSADGSLSASSPPPVPPPTNPSVPSTAADEQIRQVKRISHTCTDIYFKATC